MIRASTVTGLAAATARGETVLSQWTRDGTLVPCVQLSNAWGLNRHSLTEAESRGELFSVSIAGEQYFLGILCAHGQEEVAKVCQILQGMEASGQAIFWLRKHGGLNGKTVSQCLHEGDLHRVLEIARAWADERIGKTS